MHSFLLALLPLIVHAWAPSYGNWGLKLTGRVARAAKNSGGTSSLGLKPAPEESEDDDLNTVWDSIIRIYCTHSEPKWKMPWQREGQEQSSASGFFINIPGIGPRIMTNAHAVEYGRIIQVRRRGSGAKYEAVIEAVGNECDLAVLRVLENEAAFFSGLNELQFGALPELQDSVGVLGYPVGGESMSVTSGVVSRVEMQQYSQAGFSLLALQIDAAINPGNSGGPVVNDDLEVVGVAFQSLTGQDVENIGYVIPVTVVLHFLEDIRRNAGRYTGWCELGIHFAPLENKTGRRYLGMKPEQTGVMVLSVNPVSSAASHLERNDVLLSMDGIAVANDGSIPFRRGERVALSSYVSSRFEGDVADVRILRDGRELALQFPLKVCERLVPYHFDNAPPPYLIVAGLVFTPLSIPYLEEAGGYGSFVSEELSYLVGLAATKMPEARGTEVVILSSVLCHRANLGYEHLGNIQLKAFNGQMVTSINHLSALVEANEEKFMRFEFSPTDAVIIIDVATSEQATSEVCEENAIPGPLRLRKKARDRDGPHFLEEN